MRDGGSVDLVFLHLLCPLPPVAAFHPESSKRVLTSSFISVGPAAPVRANQKNKTTQKLSNSTPYCERSTPALAVLHHSQEREIT